MGKNTSVNTKAFGNWAEQQVLLYLKHHSFAIVHQNYRKMFGEIDLIGQKDSLVVFVEVKARSHKTPHMQELILKSKQKKIIAAAKDFLSHQSYANTVTARFDVALVQGDDHSYTLEYIEDAFQADE